MVQFIPVSLQKNLRMKALVECPHCGHSLMDKRHTINEIPSIAVIGKLPESTGGSQAVIRLSAYYGEFAYESSLTVPGGVVVEFFCPHCKASLNTERTCSECQAPMVELELERRGMLQFCLEAFQRQLAKKSTSAVNLGGRLQFCSRRNCRNHRVDFTNPSAHLKEFYEAYLPFLD